MNQLESKTRLSNHESPGVIQGVSLTEIAKEFGQPTYVYDAEYIKKQYDKLTNAFDVPSLKIQYACKALTNINIMRLLHSFGAGVDTVSIEEVQLAMHAGLSAKEIVFTPSMVSNEELGKAIAAGVDIHIDNLPQLEWMGQNHPNHPIGIRLNPEILAGGHVNIKVGHKDAKFGISRVLATEIVDIVKKYKMQIHGLHIHTGSDIKNINVFLRVADVLFDMASNFPDLQYLDFGGGIKVAYHDRDESTDIAELGRRLSDRFNKFCASYGRSLSLILEPGKFLVSGSGYFIVGVNVIKKTSYGTFAGIDSGFNHLIRPMYYDAYHEILNLSNPTGPLREYDVVGYICETDTFAPKRSIPELSPGDLIAFKNAGAYGYSMSSQYNSRCRPAEVLIHNGASHLIRKRDDIEDLLKGQLRLTI